MLGPVVGPNLRVLFVGVNPSLRSAEVGHHFARPGNRFWATLQASGWTPRRLAPEEDGELPGHGVGVTNLADRPTRTAAELSDDELRDGAAGLERVVRAHEPRLVAVVGLTAYRIAFDRPRAGVGLQTDTIGGRPVWVLPNPSGLNAHYKPDHLAELYAEARPLRRRARPSGAGRRHAQRQLRQAVDARHLLVDRLAVERELRDAGGEEAQALLQLGRGEVRAEAVVHAGAERQQPGRARAGP